MTPEEQAVIDAAKELAQNLAQRNTPAGIYYATRALLKAVDALPTPDKQRMFDDLGELGVHLGRDAARYTIAESLIEKGWPRE